jgi:Cd2+/Zn2+-exporting ATPase/Cu+-exporting ATPase
MAASTQTLEVPISGMDCTECTLHVQHAIAALPGVDKVDVFLASEKAIVRFDPAQVDLSAISDAVKEAGYTVPDRTLTPDRSTALHRGYSRQVLTLFGVVFFAVLFIVVIGEWLGVFEQLTELIPWPIWLIVIIAAGLPIFRNVLRATLHGQVISHTLMTIGMLAAVAVGQWATAAIVVFFMRVGDYAEHFTTERARRAVKDLTALAPQTARIEENGIEREVPIDQVKPGDVIVVRPGEKIPVDGEVLDGRATINQAAITGESLPVEAGPGTHVYAATFAQLGSLRLKATHVGSDTTFGRVIKLVEEAEAQRSDVQRVADKFSAYYLPVVVGIAALTLLLSRNPLATCAVLVVACSCSFALATPIAMLASIGAAAKHGLLIKGGKYIEALAQADVLLIDKTGTVTLGRPQIAEIVDCGMPSADVLQLAASAERYSEHPLAEAVRAAAQKRRIDLLEPHDFEAIPGLGVRARVNGSVIAVGNQRFAGQAGQDDLLPSITGLEAKGHTLLYVMKDEQLIGVLAASDTLRSEVPAAIDSLRSLGLQHVELLTGDNERTAATLAQQIGIPYRANLLPKDKIAIVKEYQAQGHVVVMVGDGVNDAPALAQANIGLAMGAAGSDVAIEAAHIALLRDDWMLVPRVLQIARRTMRVVKGNLAFTVGYNAIGLTLAAFGILPPVLAAAAQSLPDLGIMANSSRLIRQES